ncbi:AraC family transcriptional regulator [Neobacillus sp. PS3-40]|uniref:helix-turn-helix domain-containing protein n=1 Tax=Neobacillus sp. PS3-40 TaxID=3070679 RepID=UPI0027E09023|nr:AraC family transcriptional regulator [Neobacillus sp. PS3-40]WML42715.1 AraC family transcriptional regulator [Neobacillus sp. PS3-40]
MIVIRPKRLAPFVEKIIWQGKGSKEPYIVYPDIFNVMGFQNLGHINVLNGDQSKKLESTGITGIDSAPKTFQGTENISSVLVFFKPEALFQWKKIHPREVAGTSIGLMDFWMKESDWERILNIQDQRPYQFLELIEKMLWKEFKAVETDPWISWVVNQIISTHGSIRINELAQDVVLSRRQFGRKFTEKIGVSPKTFSQIVQFQYAINLANTRNKLVDIAFEAGYTDQSHFIKEFRKHTASIPSEFFRFNKDNVPFLQD